MGWSKYQQCQDVNEQNPFTLIRQSLHYKHFFLRKKKRKRNELVGFIKKKKTLLFSSYLVASSYSGSSKQQYCHQISFSIFFFSYVCCCVCVQQLGGDEVTLNLYRLVGQWVSLFSVCVFCGAWNSFQMGDYCSWVVFSVLRERERERMSEQRIRERRGQALSNKINQSNASKGKLIFQVGLVSISNREQNMEVQNGIDYKYNINIK